MAQITEDVVRFREITQSLYRRLGLLQRDEICCEGVTVQQCYALQVLRQEGELVQGDLAERLGIDPSSATRAVDVLVRNELVERMRPESGDRRRVILRLSREGERTTDQLIGAGDAFFSSVLSRFSPGERRDVLRLLGKLADVIAETGNCCRPFESGDSSTPRAKPSRRAK